MIKMMMTWMTLTNNYYYNYNYNNDDDNNYNKIIKNQKLLLGA